MKLSCSKPQFLFLICLLFSISAFAQFKKSESTEVLFFEENSNTHSMEGGWAFKWINNNVIIDYSNANNGKKHQIIVYKNLQWESAFELELSADVDNPLVVGDDVYYGVKDPDSAYTVMYKINTATQQKTNIVMPSNIIPLSSDDYYLNRILFDKPKNIIYLIANKYSSTDADFVIPYNLTSGTFSQPFKMMTGIPRYFADDYFYFDLNSVMYSCKVSAPTKKTKLFKAENYFKEVVLSDTDILFIERPDAKRFYLVRNGEVVKTPENYKIPSISNYYNVNDYGHKLYFMNNTTEKMDTIAYPSYRFNGVFACHPHLYIMALNMGSPAVTNPTKPVIIQKSTAIDMKFVDKKMLAYMEIRDKVAQAKTEYERCIKTYSKTSSECTPSAVALSLTFPTNALRECEYLLNLYYEYERYMRWVSKGTGYDDTYNGLQEDKEVLLKAVEYAAYINKK